jgi:hypothetical protein
MAINEVTKIQSIIYNIRGVKVMLDRDLARLYQVETRALNQAVKRNEKRFPEDFMFQLSVGEFSNLISQNVISSWGGVRKMPFAFTEQGIAMLSGLLNSDIAISVNIQIMRAFVELRHRLFSGSDHESQISELRKLLLLYIEKNDKRVNDIIIALNNLIAKPPETKSIGFRLEQNEGQRKNR